MPAQQLSDEEVATCFIYVVQYAGIQWTPWSVRKCVKSRRSGSSRWFCRFLLMVSVILHAQDEE